jgi:hypothetical protein
MKFVPTDQVTFEKLEIRLTKNSNQVRDGIREPDGRIVNRQPSFSYTDYVSSTGRILQRSSRSAGRRSRSADKEPDKPRLGGGEIHTNRLKAISR